MRVCVCVRVCMGTVCRIGCGHQVGGCASKLLHSNLTSVSEELFDVWIHLREVCKEREIDCSKLLMSDK